MEAGLLIAAPLFSGYFPSRFLPKRRRSAFSLMKPSASVTNTVSAISASDLVQLSPLGYKRSCGGGQSVSALPFGSDIYLFGNGEGVIDLYAEVSDGTFHLRMPEEQLNRPEIASTPVYQCRLGSPQRMCAKQ